MSGNLTLYVAGCCRPLSAYSVEKLVVVTVVFIAVSAS
jgi:hypothetical protein